MIARVHMHLGDGASSSGYDTPFSLLVFAGARDDEHLGLTQQSVMALQEAYFGLARALARLSASCPGQVRTIIRDIAQLLSQYRIQEDIV